MPCHTLEALALQIVSHTLRAWRLIKNVTRLERQLSLTEPKANTCTLVICRAFPVWSNRRRVGHLEVHWLPGSSSLIALPVLASSCRTLVEGLASDAGVTVQDKGKDLMSW